MPPSSGGRSAAGSVIRDEGLERLFALAKVPAKPAPSSFVGRRQRACQAPVRCLLQLRAKFAHAALAQADEGDGLAVILATATVAHQGNSNHRCRRRPLTRRRRGSVGEIWFPPPRTRKGRLLAALLPSGDGRWARCISGVGQPGRVPLMGEPRRQPRRNGVRGRGRIEQRPRG
jgi:hypothetical protein